MTTMLALVKQATGEMGLAVPSAVASNSSTDTIQQLALLNSVGYEVSRTHIWQALVKQYLVASTSTTLVGNTTQGSTTVSGIASTAGIDATYQISGTGINQATYVTAVPSGSTLTLSQAATSTATGTTFTLAKVKFAMPSDYDRLVDRTEWDKTKHWEMLGPETAQQWEWLISGYISTGPRVRYRIFGNYFQTWPMITTGDTFGFEYISNAWVTDSGGNPKTSFTADTDTCIFPDRLMVLGLKMKYFQIKGFDASSFEDDFEEQLSIAKANDAGALTLSMAPKVSNVLINWTQIPDSNYGS